MRHSKSAAVLARGGPRAPHRRGVVHSNSAARLPPPASAAWGAPSDNAGGGTGNGKLEEEEEGDEAPTGVSVADINTYFRFHPMEGPAACAMVLAMPAHTPTCQMSFHLLPRSSLSKTLWRSTATPLRHPT